MNSKHKTTLIWFAVISIFFGLNLPVRAYVLQGPHAIELMIEKLGHAKSLFVSQKLIFHRVGSPVTAQHPATPRDSNPSLDSENNVFTAQDLQPDESLVTQETQELEESLRFVFSQAFRSDETSAQSERIYVFDGGKDLTIVDGKIIPAATNRFDLYKDILLYRSRTALTERLFELGVDVSVSSLGRFEDKVAIVVGADYPDESVSQIWIDKETFLPVRWIIKGSNGYAASDTLEIRYNGWWKVGKTRYPSRIEFYQDGDLVRTSQAEKFEEDAMFSKTLFDIERLKMVYPLESAQPIQSVGSKEPSEVQKTIEEFKRIYE
jgi:hypothetical protein